MKKIQITSGGFFSTHTVYTRCPSGTVLDLRSRGHGFEFRPWLLCTNANSVCIRPRSVNEYQRKLGSKRAYHAMHWPRIHGLVTSAGVRLRDRIRDQRRPMGLKVRKKTTLLYLYASGWYCQTRPLL